MAHKHRSIIVHLYRGRYGGGICEAWHCYDALIIAINELVAMISPDYGGVFRLYDERTMARELSHRHDCWLLQSEMLRLVPVR